MFFLSPIFLLLVVGALALPSRDFDDQEVDFFRADSGSTRAPKCIAARPCVSNADCAGEGQGNQPGKPWCAGALAGVCDCAACVGGMPCRDDSKCGGLRHACVIRSGKIGTCNCLQAAQEQYDASDDNNKALFPTLAAAINQFCTKENCTNSKVGCYGLPCKKGFCVCP